jgi:hypothetical protein
MPHLLRHLQAIPWPTSGHGATAGVAEHDNSRGATEVRCKRKLVVAVEREAEYVFADADRLLQV